MDSKIGLTFHSKTSFICLPSRSKYKSAFPGHVAMRKDTAHARQPCRVEDVHKGVSQGLLHTRNIPGKVFFKLEEQRRGVGVAGVVNSQALRFRHFLMSDLKLVPLDAGRFIKGRHVGLCETTEGGGRREWREPGTYHFKTVTLDSDQETNTAYSLGPRGSSSHPYLAQPYILNIWKRRPGEVK